MKPNNIWIFAILFYISSKLYSFAFLSFGTHDFDNYLYLDVNPVTYAIDANFFSGTLPGSTDAKNSIRNAISIWDNGNDTLNFQETGTPIQSISEGTHIDFFSQNLGMPNVLAVTYPNFSSDQLTRSDIYVNTVFSWDTNSNTSSSEYSLDYIVLHEIGHALGLDHPDQAQFVNKNYNPATLSPYGASNSEVMNSSATKGTKLLVLLADDEGGRDFLYPIDDTPDSTEPPSDSYNVCTGAIVTGSAEQTNYPASNVIDGKYKEKEDKIQYWLLPDHTTGFLTIDLGQEYEITYLRWKNIGYADFSERATRDWRLQYSTDGSTFFTIASGTRQLGVSPKWASYTISPTPMRYIRFHIDSISGEGSGVIEIEAYADLPAKAQPPVGTSNIALTQTSEITANHTLSDTYAASHVIDGKAKDSSPPNYWLLPDSTKGKITIKFNQTYSISFLRWKNTHNNTDNDRATKQFRLFAGDENGMTISHVGTTSFTSNPKWYTILLANPINANKLRFKVDKYYSLGGGINEIEVYAPDGSSIIPSLEILTEETENIPSSQDNFLTDTSSPNTQFSATPNQNNFELVGLENNFAIHNEKIFIGGTPVYPGTLIRRLTDVKKYPEIISIQKPSSDFSYNFIQNPLDLNTIAHTLPCQSHILGTHWNVKHLLKFLHPYLTPNFVDWNKDGKIDLVGGDVQSQIFVYFNQGSLTQPIYDQSKILISNQAHGSSAPFVIDANHDYLYDLLVGYEDGSLILYIQQPNQSFQTYDISNPLMGKNLMPCITYWNKDNLPDLIIGNQKGQLLLCLGEKSKTYLKFSEPVLLMQTPYTYVTPVIWDVNQDGKPDMLVGEASGHVYCYQQHGNAEIPLWEQPHLLSMSVSSYATICYADLDHNGILEWAIGSGEGSLALLSEKD